MKITGPIIVICLLLLPLRLYAEPVAAVIEQTTAYGKISYPQISGLTDEKIEQFINQAIRDEAATWICDFDDSTAEKPDSADYNAKTTLRLIDNHYLSFTVQKSFYCGGMYPNDYMESYNFDLKLGKGVPLSRLLLPEMQNEKLTDFLVIGHTFTESCMDDNEVNDIAEIYRDESADISWSYYRTQGQIVFFPELAHAVQACFEEFPVPIEAIKVYLQP